MKCTFILLIISLIAFSCREKRRELNDFGRYLQSQFGTTLDSQKVYILIDRSCPSCMKGILEKPQLYDSSYFVISGLDRHHYTYPECVHFDTRRSYYYDLDFTLDNSQVIRIRNGKLKVDTGVKYIQNLLNDSI